MEQWKGFAPGVWQDEINVRNFIQKNYTQYTGDDSFLQPPTEKTKKVWGKCEDLLRQEMKNGGVLDVETKIISGIDNFAPGYIDKENEVDCRLANRRAAQAHRQSLRRHAHGKELAGAIRL